LQAHAIPNRRCKSDVAKLSERLKKGLKALESLLDERDVFAIPTRRETLAVAHKPPKKPDEKLAPVAEDDEVEAPASAKDYPLWTKRYIYRQTKRGELARQAAGSTLFPAQGRANARAVLT
jgi:hypothetical protein